MTSTAASRVERANLLRTLRRQREAVSKAVAVFCSKDRADEWMRKPAMSLDGQRPIDVLQTVQGADIANDFLTRLTYAV